MKIEGPRQTGAAGTPRKAASGEGAGFVLPAEEAAPSAAASGVRAASSLDALLALQAQGYDPQRRGRQLRRGGKTLDALEALARAHLDGAAPHAARLHLAALQGQNESTGDPALDSVLDAIDVRAAVELAKLEMSERRGAA
jgi:Class II flagellar assembly regulator